MEVENPALGRYLVKLSKTRLLSRPQELTLTQNIAQKQRIILSSNLNSPIFRECLRVLLLKQKLDIENIPHITKNLGLKAGIEDRLDYINTTLTLIDALRAKKVDISHIQNSLNTLNLTGTLIDTLSIKIKKLYDKHAGCDSLLQNLLREFQMPTAAHLHQFVDDIKKKAKYRKWQAQTRKISVVALMDLIHQYDQYRKLKLKINTLADFPEIRDIHHNIQKANVSLLKDRNTLVEKNLRLVISRARLFQNRGLPFDDLVQEGNLGLLRAINKFEPAKKLRVTTYATWWIDQGIRRAISNKSRSVRVPTHVEFRRFQLLAKIEKLTQFLGHTPTRLEILNHLAISGIDFDLLQTNGAIEQEGQGFKASFIAGDESEDMFNIEQLPANAQYEPDYLVEEDTRKKAIRAILSKLSPQNEMIIRLTYGIGEPCLI